jgi:hypothetical protein
LEVEPKSLDCQSTVEKSDSAANRSVTASLKISTKQRGITFTYSPQIIERGLQMKLRHAFFVAAAIFALACTDFAGTIPVEVDLGTSAQNLVETGIGNNGANFAQWFIQQGSCSFNGTDTTCTLSGNYTGSTPGFTSGTYALLTTYVGNTMPSPLRGISSAPFSSFFNFNFIPAGTTITLDLNESGGGLTVVPIWNGTTFVNGYTLTDTSMFSCTPSTVSPCTPYEVGVTPGAVFASTVTGVADFTETVPAPEPSSITLVGMGIVVITFVSRRKAFQL